MQIEELNEVKEQVSNSFYVMVNIHTHTHTHTHYCPFLGGLRHVDVYFAPKKKPLTLRLGLIYTKQFMS